MPDAWVASSPKGQGPSTPEHSRRLGPCDSQNSACREHHFTAVEATAPAFVLHATQLVTVPSFNPNESDTPWPLFPKVNALLIKHVSVQAQADGVGCFSLLAPELQGAFEQHLLPKLGARDLVALACTCRGVRAWSLAVHPTVWRQAAAGCVPALHPHLSPCIGAAAITQLLQHCSQAQQRISCSQPTAVHTISARDPILSPCGSQLAVIFAAQDPVQHHIRVYDVFTGKILAVHKQQPHLVTLSFAWSGDGRRLVLVLVPQNNKQEMLSCRVIHSSSGQQISLLSLPFCMSSLCGVSLSPAGCFVVLHCRGKGQERPSAVICASSHGTVGLSLDMHAYLTIAAVVWQRNDSHYATTQLCGGVWRLSVHCSHTRKVVYSTAGQTPVGFSPNGQYLAMADCFLTFGGMPEPLQVVEVRTGRIAVQSIDASSACFSADSRKVALHLGGSLEVRELATGARIAQLHCGPSFADSYIVAAWPTMASLAVVGPSAELCIMQLQTDCTMRMGPAMHTGPLDWRRWGCCWQGSWNSLGNAICVHSAGGDDVRIITFEPVHSDYGVGSHSRSWHAALSSHLQRLCQLIRSVLELLLLSKAKYQ